MVREYRRRCNTVENIHRAVARKKLMTEAMSMEGL